MNIGSKQFNKFFVILLIIIMALEPSLSQNMYASASDSDGQAVGYVKSEVTSTTAVETTPTPIEVETTPTPTAIEITPTPAPVEVTPILTPTEAPMEVVYNDLHVTEYLELKEDMIVGNLNANSSISLNGFCLTVNGDVSLSEYSTVYFNGGSIECKGSFSVYDCANIKMVKPEDYLLVGKDFNWSSYSSTISYMSNGTLEIKGNFIQKGKAGYESFLAGYNHKTILSGDTLQTIITESTDSSFAILEIKNYSEAGVVASQPIYALEIITNDCKFSVPISGIEGWTLSEDQVIDGDLDLTGGILDLNGHTLTVKGNFNQQKGTADINGGKLLIEGDYSMTVKSVSGSGITYSEGSSSIIMINPADYIMITGDFYMDSYQWDGEICSEGIIEIKGNVLRKADSKKTTFVSSNNHKFIFSGLYQAIGYENISSSLSINEELQYNILDGNGEESKVLYSFANIVVQNGTYINFVDGVAVTKNIITNGSNIYGGLYIENNIVLQEDLQLGELYMIKGSLDLNGHKLIVKNDILISGNIKVNKGRLECYGDFIGKYVTSGNYLTMQNPEDYVLVYGNYNTESGYSYAMTDGILEVKGDFTQNDNGQPNQLFAEGNHKVILTGDTLQIVTMKSIQSKFGMLEIQNFSEEGIAFRYQSSVDTLIDNGCSMITNQYVTRGFELDGDMVWEGGMYLASGTLKLNGHTLIINGNLIQGRGIIYSRYGGKLIVHGDYRIQTMDETCEGIVYSDSPGYIKNEYRSYNYYNLDIVVDGNFIMASTTEERYWLASGSLEVKGDFIQKNTTITTNFCAYNNFTVVLSGDSEQRVSFDSTDSYFNNLYINNSSDAGVVLDTDIVFNGQAEDQSGNISGIGSAHSLWLYNWSGNYTYQGYGIIPDDTTIGGKLTATGLILSAGQILHVDEFELISGNLNMTGGSLYCSGSMKIGENAKLLMTVVDSYIMVGGDFETHSKYSHQNLLTNGTLEIKGNFAQYNDSKSFIANYKHNVILSGDTLENNVKQNVYFEDPGTSKFQELTITKPIEKGYSFNAEVNTICSTLTCAYIDNIAPSKVQGLLVKSITETNVELEWEAATDNATVVGYYIYRNDDEIAFVETTSFIDTNLLPNTEYCYYIVAVDALDNISEDSQEVFVTSLEDIQAPNKPLNAHIIRRTGSSIILSWNTSLDNVKTTGYEVYRNGTKIADVTIGTTYRDQNIKLGDIYQYQIKAYDGSGNKSELSGSVNGFAVMPLIKSMIPKDYSEVGGDTVNFRVIFSDSGNSIGNKVKFEYRKVGEEWKNFSDILVEQNKYSTNELYAQYEWNTTGYESGTYDIRVTLFDEDLNTYILEVQYILDKTAPEKSDKVSGVSNNGIINLIWTASVSEDCSYYTIYRAQGDTTAFTKIAVVNGRYEVTYIDDDVIEEETYYYRVTASDEFKQESEAVESLPVIVEPDKEAPIIVAITPSTFRIKGVNDITVTAIDNIGVTEITLKVKAESSTEWIVLEKKEAQNGSAIFTWDTTGLDGVYILCATSIDKNGNQSTEEYTKSYEVDNTGISKIYIRDITSETTSVSIHWFDVEDKDFAYFQVEQKVVDGFQPVGKVVDTLGMHITGLLSNTLYTFRVVGYDNLNNRGISSDEATIETTSDITKPIVTSFYPAHKYYGNSIPLSISVRDDIGVTSLELQYSYDKENWTPLVILKPDKVSTAHTYSYKFDVSKLSEGEIFISAKAYDAAGNVSSYNGENLINNFYIDRTAPEKVSDLTVEGRNGYIALDWTTPNDTIVGCRIYRADVDTGIYSVLENKITSANYYDVSAIYDKVYSYKIALIDQAGNVSELSNEAVAQMMKDTEKPSVHGISPSISSRVGLNQEFIALVSDNVVVKQVIFEFKASDREEDIWETFETVDLNSTYGYVKATWNNSFLDNKEYKIRVSAIDAEGNASNDYEVGYTLDTKAPEVKDFKAEPKGYRVQLNWSACDGDDFAYFEIYRETVWKEGFVLLLQTEGTSYVDKILTAGSIYKYKVVAYDKSRNSCESEILQVVPTNEDDETPVAILSENISGRVGCEVLFDSSASTDNVRITKYLWDFGNSDTAEGAIVKYSYALEGTYKVTLTVFDAAGNKSLKTSEVKVLSVLSSELQIVVADKSDNVLGYSYIYTEDEEGKGTNYSADSMGSILIATEAGTYTIAAYKEGYLPKNVEIVLKPGASQRITINLEKSEVVTGTLTTKRLELQELIYLGVDLQDENNWYTYTYSYTYTTSTEPIPKTYFFNIVQGITTKVTIPGNSGSSGTYYYKMTDVYGKKIVTRYRTVKYLKKMFDVELTITNNAEEQYIIVDSTVYLNIPDGLSLVNINEPQSLLINLGEIAGQESKTAHWYIKADKPGSYDLSAGFNGTLTPFNAVVAVEIKADEPLVVTEAEDNTWTDDGFVNVNYKNYFINVYGIDSTLFDTGSIQGAIVTLEYNGLKSQSITNSDGCAMVQVNENDDRTFKLTVTRDGYYNYESESYKIDTYGYADTISLAAYGTKSFNEVETNDEESDFELLYVSLNGRDLSAESYKLNSFLGDNNTLEVISNQQMVRCELSQKGKILKYILANNTTCTWFNIINNELIADEKVYLTIYVRNEAGDLKYHKYELPIEVFNNITHAEGEFNYSFKTERDYKSNFFYDDDYFKFSSYNYNQQLATMSLCLAMSAFNSNETDKTNHYNYEGKSQNVSMLFEKIGFKEFTENYDFKNEPDTDTIGVAAANKNIEFNGNNYTLIAVAIRGGGYEREWASNFQIGTSGQHQGFDAAKEQVLEFLRDYIINNNITGDIKIWITGYSRAAATSNLVAGALDQGESLGSSVVLDRSNLYAYCFETPAGAIKSEVSLYFYENIFNIINPNDPVPKVAPEGFGFGRYGIDLYIPTVLSGSFYATKRDAMLSKYYELDNISEANKTKPYVVDDFHMKKVDIQYKITLSPTGLTQTMVYPIIIDDEKNHMSQDEYLRLLITSIVKENLKSRDNYVNTYQDGIGELMSVLNRKKDIQNENWNKFRDIFKEKLKNNIGYLIASTSPLGESIVGSTTDLIKVYAVQSLNEAKITTYSLSDIESMASTLALLIKDIAISHPNLTATMIYNYEGIGAAHYPELCLAWMQSMDSNYTEGASPCFNNGSYRIIRLNCPVDVALYDASGNLVASIINDTPIDIEGSSIISSINGNGEKLIYVPTDLDYNIHIKATSDGTMTYSINEYSPEAGDINRLINYYNIPIQTNNIFIGTVPAYSSIDTENGTADGSSAVYRLTTSEGTVITASNELKGTDAMAAFYMVYVASENNDYGAVSGQGIYQLGNYAQVIAKAYEGYTFAGWYVGETCISTDSTYRFCVMEETALLAKYNIKNEPEIPNYKDLYSKITVNGVTSNYIANKTLYIECKAESQLKMEIMIPEELQNYIATENIKIKIKYKTSDSKVANVTGQGLVTAKKTGTVKITTTITIGDETLTFSTEITVNKSIIK